MKPETAFGQLPFGQRFLDLTGGYWWVKTGSYKADCDDLNDFDYYVGQAAKFRADDPVALTKAFACHTT